MKPHPPEVDALFTGRQFVRFDLYTFRLAGGGVLRYCAGDRAVTYNGDFYSSSGVFDGDTSQGGPYFDTSDNKAKLHQKIGPDVDTLVFDMLPGAATVFGAPFATACIQDQFQGAELDLDRIYMAGIAGAFDTHPVGFNVFKGRIGDIDVGRSKITFTVNSWLELLNQMFPRNLIQPGCINNLGDSTCQVNLAGFTNTGTVQAGSTRAIINSSALPLPNAGYYDTGVITMTSGVLSGLSRTVITASATVVSLLWPFAVAPSPGDTFSISAGCDKSSGLPIQIAATLENLNQNATLAEPTPGITVGGPVTGTGIPGSTTVLSVDGTDLVLSNAATITGQSTLTFAVSANGCAKFSNQARFRGVSFVPTPPTAF